MQMDVRTLVMSQLLWCQLILVVPMVLQQYAMAKYLLKFSQQHLQVEDQKTSLMSGRLVRMELHGL